MKDRADTKSEKEEGGLQSFYSGCSLCRYFVSVRPLRTCVVLTGGFRTVTEILQEFCVDSHYSFRSVEVSLVVCSRNGEEIGLGPMYEKVLLSVQINVTERTFMDSTNRDRR